MITTTDMTHHTTAIGTIGGTLLTIFTLSTNDLQHTLAVALFGAIISYTASIGLKLLHKWIIKKFFN